MASIYLREQKIINDLMIATSFVDRGIGLLHHSVLNDNQAMWINPCNNIHTFFMKFAIDCVFVNKNLEIVSMFKNVKPYRMILPQWQAKSVFELSAGFIEKYNLQIGEKLHVGD